jgi:hypothetical protein
MKRRPREFVRQALQDALDSEAPLTVREVAMSLGLRDHRRLLRRFPELCRAIGRKNRSKPDAGLPQMENVLREAIAQAQPPSVKQVANLFGFRDATSVYRRFPDLAKALRTRKLAATTSAARGPTVPEHVQLTLRAAQVEEPPPSLREVAKRIATHKSLVRRAFPELWASIRTRHQEHKNKMTAERHRLLEKEVLRIVGELQEAGVAPLHTLVRSKLSNSPLRCLEFVAEAISKALAAFSNRSAQ